MNHDEHLTLLGLATARSHQLELVTSQILARALRLGDGTGRLLTTAMGPSAALGVLSTLIDWNDCGPVPVDSLRIWLRQARSANTVRNQVIHTPWVVTAESGTTPDAVLDKRSARLIERTDEELRQDIELIGAAVDRGYGVLADSHQ